MATKLFVGGLAYAVTDSELNELFATVGNVQSAQVIMDRSSNQSKGFGFVEMGSEEEAKKAIAELNGKQLQGRSIIVSEARPREDKPRDNFNSNRGFGGNRPRY